jgi:DNA (cytosine-5)-methyltransferase 1
VTIIDLFAGPGGWDTGLRMIGETDVLGIEWDKHACDTARAAGHERLQADIAKLNPLDIGDYNTRGLIASPPCQGFTMAGAGRGRQDSEALIRGAFAMGQGTDPRFTLKQTCQDERSVLALEPLRWALDLEPDWMAWEQVPAVLPLWEACAEVLRQDGYNVWTGLLHAETFGVPQTRKRAILIASTSVQVQQPLATHSRFYPRSPEKLDPGTKRWVSMADALSWGMTHRPYPCIASGRSTGGPDKEKVGGSNVRKSIYKELEEGRWIPQPANEGDTQADCAWSENRPSPTIVGSFCPDVVAAPGYRKPGDGPRQKAKGSIRIEQPEASILQSFPVDYPWAGPRTAQFRQIGDAVPPLMAAHVVSALGVGNPCALTQEAA